jgi:hypothetical protein
MHIIYNINYLRHDISSFVNVVTTYRCAWNVNNYDSKLDKHKIVIRFASKKKAFKYSVLKFFELRISVLTNKL